MIYFLAVVSGIVGSVVGLILFVVLTVFLLPRPEGAIGIVLLSPMPLGFALGGFVLGAALALKLSN
jgi:hypothetical protein